MYQPSDFNFPLHQDAIAQTPASPRDSAKLMRVSRQNGSIQHAVFRDLVDILTPNDVLVLNDSKVFPARLLGRKDTGGHIEVLLLQPLGSNRWEALARGIKNAQHVQFSSNFSGSIIKNYHNGKIIIQLESSSEIPIDALIDQTGQTPIPPYIHPPLSEAQLRQEYQTVYASNQGSAAAPTAGLHFTTTLLAQLQQKGVAIEHITLHVGLGTFAKLKPENIASHTLHHEWYSISKDTAAHLNQAKQSGKRIIAVGTTSCRTLESAGKSGVLQPGSNTTGLFIMPPYQFKFTDALITNFHLPESSLLMMVTAFCSAPNTTTTFSTFADSLIGRAYHRALANHYRFFSFGDAMLIE